MFQLYTKINDKKKNVIAFSVKVMPFSLLHYQREILQDYCKDQNIKFFQFLWLCCSNQHTEQKRLKPSALIELSGCTNTRPVIPPPTPNLWVAKILKLNKIMEKDSVIRLFRKGLRSETFTAVYSRNSGFSFLSHESHLYTYIMTSVIHTFG